ncbi:MAG: gliding motility-associated C-terminal domain-containing protein [Bacteroidia bacterium]|nr:gliding motility-associated C-terminal domain-containing protein [Bacteroidia bacterium]
MRLIAWLVFIVLSCSSGLLYATHNRAGEITYRHLGGYQIEATITTYTKADSQADRASLGIHWGDGTVDTIQRLNGNGQGELIAPDLKKNIYRGIHIYPGPAGYTMFFEDPNRNGGVVNIPNSVNIPFYVSTQLLINPFVGINNSVQLLNPPIDKACPGQIFIHNPGAWDPDGDSISYRLVSCRGEGGQAIPGFTQPQATNSFNLDPVTGDLIWDAPPATGLGEYNVAFVIEEWRRGVLLGSVTRDMQIDVVPCTNTPPLLSDMHHLCVLAGETVSFKISASDVDFPHDLITLSATGGPFELAHPGKAQFAPVTGKETISQDFIWQTACNHVRKQPWVISFRVGDNGNPNLAAYGSSSVKVIAPAPALLSASALGNTIRLEWTESPCKEATGYEVYRRTGPSNFTPGNCITGIPAAYGFERIAILSGLATLGYIDSAGLQPGVDYCYRIVARFPDGAESYASNELCTTLRRDVPIMTHVSVLKTDPNAGAILLAWRPATEIDSLQWPPPYAYQVERASGNMSTQWQDIGTTADTSFVDTSAGLNTSGHAWNYRIRLITSSGLVVGRSLPAASLFMKLKAFDNSIEIQLEEQVPWTNHSYTLFRKEQGSADYDSITVFSGLSYRDSGLANHVSYCYKLRSSGAYSTLPSSGAYLNFSQEQCLAPIDLEPPCAAIVMVQTSCDSMFSRISIGIPPGCIDDVLQGRLLFKPAPDGETETLASWGKIENHLVEHVSAISLAGCYQVITYDSVGNSAKSTWVCVDNCPEYRLPDSFSPNNDGVNDEFRPYPYAFIAGVRMKIFNRWGIEVFETTNPEIKWTGRAKNGGLLLPDGVYFYVCEVDEIRLQGIITRRMKGIITMLGSGIQSNE